MALAVALTLHAACTGDDSDDDSSVITDPVETSDSTTSTSSSSTTETTVDPQAEVEAEVEAAYLAYLDAFFEIFGQPDPTNPLIERHTTGQLRQTTLDAISQDIAEGRSLRRPEDDRDFNATVLEVRVDGDAATAQVCLVDGTIVIDNASGAVLNDAVVTLRLEADLVIEDEVWKVSDSNTVERHEGRRSCDE